MDNYDRGLTYLKLFFIAFAITGLLALVFWLGNPESAEAY